MTRFNSALDCAAAIRSKEISPSEVLDHYLSVTDRLDPTLNAFALRDDERARAEAARATDVVANSAPEDLAPFHGVPIPIKDLNNVEGWLTTFGSDAAPDSPAATDDQVVKRLRDAGFVLMGKTTTPEFGAVSVTESKRFGATSNPWNPEYSSGGSSGGAASAVAAGMAPIAHASDGGGSIRIPASCTGLVGLKPSRNRINDWTEKLHGGSTSGMVCRTIADAAATLDVLAPQDPGAWNNAPAPSRPWASEVGAPVERLRIRVATRGAGDMDVPASLADAVSHTADVLADIGHEVVESEPLWPDLLEFFAGFMAVWGTITASVEGLDAAKLEPHNRESLAGAAERSSIDYAKAVLSLQRMSREFVSQFGSDFDVLVTPTMAIEPPKVGWLFEGSDENPGVIGANALPMAAFTAIFNVTGQPALSLPLHVSESGLPIGVQFAAPPWREDLLIRLGAQLEAEMPWADRWPAMAG